jgi:Mg-chelatase subunit ChlD
VKKELISIPGEIKRQNIRLVVIDSSDSFLDIGYNKEIVEAGFGQYYRLNEISSSKVVEIVKELSAPEEA